MRQLLFESPEKVSLKEALKPVCGKDQVLLKVKRIGVCGTDIQIFMGRNKYMTFPVVPFHEGLAIVEEISDTVDHVKAGDLVTILPLLSCGKCYSCRQGKTNACENFNILGIQSDGLGADYFAVDKRFVYPLPQNIDWDKAILIEPFAVGVHAAVRGEVQGKNIMVVGGGTIGNLVAQASKLLGAKKVCVCDISDDKIKMAQRADIDVAINTKEISLTQAAQEAFGGFPDVLFDCVGSKAMLTKMLELAGKTTTVVIVANYSELAEIDMTKIQRNELDVKGSITYTEEDFKKAIELVAEGRVYLDGFITGRFTMEAAQEMMEQCVIKRGINMKTIMDYE